MNKRQKKKAFKKRIITMNSSISIGIHMPVKNSRNNKKENQPWSIQVEKLSSLSLADEEARKFPVIHISIGYSDGI